MDTISTTHETLTLEDIDFHPKIRAEIELELKKWCDTLRRITPDRLQSAQGKVEILEWILGRMMSEVIQKEQEKAKALDAIADKV